MDRWQAIHTLWSSFGLTAYEENTVPDSATLPYITYAASVADFNEIVSLTASIYYRSYSWTEISQKADEIGEIIGSGYGVPYDNGRLWITKATPFAQNMDEPSDPQIRRKILQVTGEFQ